MVMQLRSDKSKYVITSILLGCSLLLISYTNIVIVVEENRSTDYTMYTFWPSLSLLAFGVGIIFTEKKTAIMLALAAPVIISFFMMVFMFATGIPVFPHLYFG